MLEGSPYLRHHCAALHVEACVAMTSRPGATQVSHSAASLFCCPFLLSTAHRMCNCLGIYAVKFLHFFLSSFAFLFPSLINQLPRTNYHSVERSSITESIMSFLTRTINVSRTAAVVTPVSRIAAVRTSRTFTTSLAAQRTATEAVKDELKHIDRAVSDKLVDGINIASMS